MKRIFQGLLSSLMLLTVAMLSALTAMRLAIHGRETRVPKLTGLTLNDAERAAAAADVGLAVDDSFYSAEFPAGSVLSQYPPPNDKVRTGWRVRIALSLGPQRTDVPDITGMGGRAAEVKLQRFGFDPGAVAELPSAQEEGTVLAQSPMASSTTVLSPKVSELFAVAPVERAWVMPSLIGRTATAAIAAIHAAGLNVDTEPATAPTDPTVNAPEPGVVLQQTPAPGSKITSAETVHLVLAP